MSPGSTAVRFEISTYDGGELPPTSRLCLEGEGIAICQPLTTSVRSFLARHTTLAVVRVTASSIVLEATDLAPGTYLVRLTGLAPYADITASLDFREGAVVIQPIVLTRPPAPTPTVTPPTPDPTSTAAPRPPETIPSDSMATPGAVPTEEPTIRLPNTGARPGNAAPLPFLLMLLGTLGLGIAGLRIRRERS